ncbi:MAG TPA: adenylate/guanylate cyclase domain-containing protein, partial [Polyangiaceae bacterium]|nr:adenylate/guanylate cyclase domain-containing protein [Polyangiaceae bacterium]
LSSIEQELERAAATRFTGPGARLLVVDAERRAVAVHGIAGLKPGQSAAALGIWRAMPNGVTRVAHVGVVTSHVEDGVAMLGAFETVGALGWSVAVFRPEADAYRALDTLRRRTLAVVVGAVLLALVLGVLVARAITSPVLAIAEGARRIGQRRWGDVRIDVERTDELGELASSVQQMSSDLQASEREIAHQAKVRGDLSRYMSRDLVDAIVRGEHSLELGGRRAAISVLFADVVAFTPLAESRPAEEVVGLLNELFSMLTEIVFRHGGTVDKFIGDCIMAIWGAPVAQDDHAQRALAAGEDMLRFLETANEGFREKYGVEIRLGIGINSGEAIVGNIGSDKRMEYTVIGDVVNVAARLEAIAAPNQLLVAAETRRLVGDDFDLTSLGQKNLTGRTNSTGVYQLETKS